MKTISTLFVLSLLNTSLFANDFGRAATLTVKSADKEAIVVVVDNIRYDLGGNAVMICDLDPCDHQVIVYREKPSVYYFQKAYDVVFNSSVSLQPRTNLEIAIDDCGIITMNESRSSRHHLGDDWHGENYSNENAFIKSDVYSNAISNYDFSRVLWAINKESSEANRMRSAQQIISNNYFSCAQVKQLLGLIGSENNKLELAKLAYDKTVDPAGYDTVADLLHVTDNRSELARCITH